MIPNQVFALMNGNYLYSTNAYAVLISAGVVILIFGLLKIGKLLFTNFRRMRNGKEIQSTQNYWLDL